MNPSSKRGFHMLLVLFKVLPSLLLRILGLGRNPNKTLGLELINFSRIPYKIHMIHTRIHTQVSSIPFCSSIFFLFSSSSLPLPLLLSFPLIIFFSSSPRFGLSKMRDQLLLSHGFVKAMFGHCIFKPFSHFCT